MASLAEPLAVSLEDPPVELPASAAAVGLFASSFFAVDGRDADERSFFAQPEPLKWMAGVVNAFVIVPSAPHSGQKRGPWSLMP